MELELKPDMEATVLRCIVYLAVLNLPFAGVFKQAALGNWSGDQPILAAVATAVLAASVACCGLFARIRFGWNAAGVYKQGMFRRTEIAWDAIEKIYDTGSAQEWTEGDMLFTRKKGGGRRVFVIESRERKIVLELYRSVIDLKQSLAKKLNMEIGDQYNVVWDFLGEFLTGRMMRTRLWTSCCLLGLALCGAPMAAASESIDYAKRIASIGKGIEALKGRFPQLDSFSVSRHVDTARLAITYGRKTHPSARTGGWTSGVPNPDPDGVWFYIDFHDPGSTLQIHTQPVIPPYFLGDKRVSLLLLEGEKTASLSQAIHELLVKQGMRL